MEETVQTTNTQPVTPPQTSPTHRNLVPLIVVALIAATLGSLGTYFIMSSNQNKESQLSYQQTSPNQALSPSPTVAVSTSNWSVYTNIASQYQVEYPQGWITVDVKDPSGLGSGLGDMSSYTGFTVKDGKSHLVWLKAWKNPQRLTPVQFWAQKDAFWEHVDEGTAQQRQQEAQKYFDKMERVSVGENKVEGYKITVADTLASTEIYWFIDDGVFNLGFSPQDKAYDYTAEQKEEIVNHMLSTFESTK